MAARAGRVGVSLRSASVIALAAFLLPLLPSEEGEARGIGSSSARGDCRACHGQVALGGHPVDVAPRSAVVPEGWPLDAAGRLTCATCHLRCGEALPLPSSAPQSARAPSSWRLSSQRKPRVGDTLRSGLAGEAFCAECHAPKAAAGAESVFRGERARLEPAAVPSPSRGRRAVVRSHARFSSSIHPAQAEIGPDGIDLVSRQCLACHDGTVGVSSEVAVGEAPGIGVSKASHPIGINYPTQARPGSEGSFVPRGFLDPRMALPQGKVGCLSCHDLFSTEAKLLVLPMQESRLCYACHDILRPEEVGKG